MAKRTKASGKNQHSQRFRVNLALQAKDIARADAAVTFKIEGASGRLGTIQIGQGTFGWRGSYGQKFKRIRWDRFFELMPETGRRA